MLKRCVLVGALLLGSITVQAKTPSMDQCLKLLESPKTRARAIDPLQQFVYSCDNEKQRSRCRALLLAWLKQESQPERRAPLVDLLSRFLSHETTPTADFEKCFEFLTDSDPNVVHSMWLEFGQQASLKAMTPALRERMLALTESPRPEIRLEAVSWAHRQALERGVHGEEVPKEFQQRALKVQQTHLQDADPRIRNEALYGCLALAALDPKGTQALALAHLREQDPNSRSLILDFLERNPYPELAPELEKRLAELSDDSKQHFPSPEDELNPPGRAPAEPEPYRVVRVLSRLGPLSPAAWTYLETRGLQQLVPEALLYFVSSSGPEANALADKLFPKFSGQALGEALIAWSERGLSGPQLESVQELMEKQKTNDIEGRLQQNLYLAILANSPPHPKSIQLAWAALKDKNKDVQLAAIFALSKLDPQGPGGQAALQALRGYKPDGYILGVPFAEIASDRLSYIPEWLSKDPLLHPQQPAPDPTWLERMGEDSPLCAGTRLDLLKLRLRWLEAHPQQAHKAKDKLTALTRHPDSRVVALVQASLARLQPPP
ncbi:hypothetical protein JST97_18255 [bacterium]|nr:hypothetical protein [bacterium]